MEDENPYRPSGAPSAPRPEHLPHGSLERGIAGDYELAWGRLFREAWNLTADLRTWFVLLTSMLLFYAVAFGVSYGLGLASLTGESAFKEGRYVVFVLLNLVSGLVPLPIIGPLGATLTMMGIRRAGGGVPTFDQILGYFPRILPIMGVNLPFSLISPILVFPLMFVELTPMALAGFLVTVPAGFYVFLIFSMALPLALEKGLGVIAALDASRRALGARLFQVIRVYLVLFCFVIGGSIVSCGLGMFFILPFMTVFFGLVYRVIFGISRP